MDAQLVPYKIGEDIYLPDVDQHIIDIQKRAIEYRWKAEKLVVDSLAKRENASKGINDIRRDIDDLKKDYRFWKDPVVKLAKRLDKYFGDIEDELKAADKIVEKKILDYDTEVKRELEAKQIQIDELKRLASIEQQPLTPEILDEEKRLASLQPSKTTTYEAGHGTQTKMTWTYDVINLEEVPVSIQGLNGPITIRSLDNTAVMKAIHSGIRDIPGLRIYQEPTLARVRR